MSDRAPSDFDLVGFAALLPLPAWQLTTVLRASRDIGVEFSHRCAPLRSVRTFKRGDAFISVIVRLDDLRCVLEGELARQVHRFDQTYHNSSLFSFLGSVGDELVGVGMTDDGRRCDSRFL